MKKILYKVALAISLSILAINISAQQQVNTLYFIDNAPVRQNINPAFTPLPNFYLSLPVIGGTNLWVGNAGYHSLTPSDLVFNNADGQTITFLHPDADREKFLNGLGKTTLLEMSMDMNILSLGFRFKQKNYMHITVNERLDMGVGLPKDMFNFLLGGGMQDLNGGNNMLDLTTLGFNMMAYTEVGLGYTRKINDKWSMGLKLKYLAGNMHLELANKELTMNPTANHWDIYGNGSMYMSAPVVTFPEQMPTLEELQDPMQLLGLNDLTDNFNLQNDWKRLITPAGNGVALDLGFEYRPVKNFAISASVTDLGFIRWKGAKFDYGIEGSYQGVGELQYNDFVDESGQFNTQILQDTLMNKLSGLYNNMEGEYAGGKYTRALSAKLNVGVDLNFWDNRVGLGLYSRTRFVSNQVYEELTIGASFKPIHVLNIAASYSLINGKQHTIGAAIGLVTWEGIGLYLAADYIPLTYAKANGNYVIPYYNNGFNLAFGLNVVIGYNYKKIKEARKAAKEAAAAEKKE